MSISPSAARSSALGGVTGVSECIRNHEEHKDGLATKHTKITKAEGNTFDRPAKPASRAATRPAGRTGLRGSAAPCKTSSWSLWLKRLCVLDRITTRRAL